MPRKARIDAPGALQHIIFRGIERWKIFWTDEDRDDFVERLCTVIEETSTACHAWALLPNHFHLLLKTGNTSLATAIRWLLGAYWEDRYHATTIESGVHLRRCLTYIDLTQVKRFRVQRSGLKTPPTSSYQRDSVFIVFKGSFHPMGGRFPINVPMSEQLVYLTKVRPWYLRAAGWLLQIFPSIRREIDLRGRAFQTSHHLLTQSLVDEVHKAHGAIHVFLTKFAFFKPLIQDKTMDEQVLKTALFTLLETGVDGIMTDYPLLVSRVLNEWKSSQ